MSEDGHRAALVRPARHVRGTVRLPGDKSISHRYAMLGAVAEGRTHLQNFSSGADCASTLSCVESLGVAVQRGEAGMVEIHGGVLQPPRVPLDCGNSGSTMRMLSGILAGQPFESELTGDASLSRRPMQRIIEPLGAMGARISSHDGCPPLRIKGGDLRGIEYRPPVASAQVKSAVLLAGMFAQGESWVEEPVPTRDHTELALVAFGARVQRSGRRAGIRGGQRLRGIEAYVPGDISSAAFFLCAAALFPESQLVIDSVCLNPTRATILDVLAAMGVRISMLHVAEQHGELVGTIAVEGGEMRGARLSGSQTAALIDELPVLAAIAPYSLEGIEIRDARELRVKESDRIAAVAHNLRAMGARVEELEDGLLVPGKQVLHGAEVDSRGDHRIAMAFAVAALRAQGESLIHGAEAVGISFPEFFSLLRQIIE